MAPPGHAQRWGGHRTVPHTADLRVEAWGPTREECLAHAVRGVCESFLDMRGAAAVRKRDVALRPETNEDLLTALLEEVVYRLDTEGEVPVDVAVTEAPGGLRVALEMADAGSLPVTGAVPKAVTLHGLVGAGGLGLFGDARCVIRPGGRRRRPAASALGRACAGARDQSPAAAAGVQREPVVPPGHAS